MRKGWSIGLMGVVVAAGLAGPAWAIIDIKPPHKPLPVSPPVPPPWTRGPLVQIALVLDTSNGMEGLVDQARKEIWSVANEVTLAGVAGLTPMVQIGVLEYANNAAGQRRGYTRIVVPFTANIDKVFDALSSIRTNGGDEFCGRAILEAVLRLEWSPYPEDLRMLFIAGDESFTDGPTDYRRACQEAVARGIPVNPLYWGPYANGIHRGWAHAAVCTGGTYLGLSGLARPVYRKASVDESLIELNRQLNETYRLLIDPHRNLLQHRLERDRDIALFSQEAALQRIITKAAQGLMQDPIGTPQQGDMVTYETALDIPNTMTEKALNQFQAQTAERQRLRMEILRLGQQRRLERIDQASSPRNEKHSLSSAVIQVLHEQLTQRVLVQSGADSVLP